MRRNLSTVHPHGCGEHRHPAIINNDQVGSSPRVWGTRYAVFSELFVERFIPTGVGNTKKAAISVKLPPVHPHGCGEHTDHNILLIKRNNHSDFSTEKTAVFYH